MKLENIKAYQNSKKLYPIIVKVTRAYPGEAAYLTNQSCRAANSIHAAIAEGFGRSVLDFKRYLTIALGSNNELLSHLEDAFNLGYLKKETYEKLKEYYSLVGKQIYRLREKWKKF